MKLVYAKLTPPNFGDELNAYLWPRLFPGLFADPGSVDFIGIGTILSRSVSRENRRKIVFGTGAGYWDVPALDDKWKIYFVRGAITAKLLGIGSESAITDAAYCLAFIDDIQSEASGKIVFMPHHKSETEVDWVSLCNDAGFCYVSPTLDVEAILGILKSAKLIITEAMHGAIMADLFRVPWIPIRYGSRSLDLKWHDWCGAMSMTYSPVDLPPLLDMHLSKRETLERAVKKAGGLLGLGKDAWKATPVFRSGTKLRDAALKLLIELPKHHGGIMSSDAVLDSIKDRLWGKVRHLRADFRV